MFVMIKRAGELPEATYIRADLAALQGQVDGYIETVCLGNDVILICDEDGKLKGKEPNFLLGDDVVVGDCLFVGMGEEDFTDITDDQIEYVLDNILTETF